MAQTFFVDENVGRKTRLDAVVTVADAMWLKDRLKDAPEAKNQIAFADVILLNKTDLVSPEELADVEARIRGINPYARVHKTERCASRCRRCSAATPSTSTASSIWSRISWRPASSIHTITIMTMVTIMATITITSRSRPRPSTMAALKHYHDEDMQSVSITLDKPLDPDKFFPWVQDLVQKEGPSILRCKGIISFKDDADRFVLQGVHMILDGDHQRPWKDGEKRTSRMVFIGRNLPVETITQGFAGCVA